MRISIQPSLSKSKNAQPPPIDSTIYVTSPGVPYRMGCVRPACAAISVKREKEGRDQGSEAANAVETRGAQREPAPASKVRRNRRREEKLAMVFGEPSRSSGITRTQHLQYLQRRSIRGIDSYCVLRRFSRLSISGFAGKRGSQVCPALDGAGVRRQGLAKLLFRFAILSLLAEQSAEIDRRCGEMRCNPESAPEVFFRRGQFAALCCQNAKLILSLGKIGIESESSLQGPPFPRQISCAIKRHSQVVLQGGVFWIGSDCVPVKRNRCRCIPCLQGLCCLTGFSDRYVVLFRRQQFLTIDIELRLRLIGAAQGTQNLGKLEICLCLSGIELDSKLQLRQS